MWIKSCHCERILPSRTGCVSVSTQGKHLQGAVTPGCNLYRLTYGRLSLSRDGSSALLCSTEQMAAYRRKSLLVYNMDKTSTAAVQTPSPELISYILLVFEFVKSLFHWMSVTPAPLYLGLQWVDQLPARSSLLYCNTFLYTKLFAREFCCWLLFLVYLTTTRVMLW